jgi:glucosylceramidase
VTIDPATGAITRNVEYYVLGHASRFILPGAYRVGSAIDVKAVEAAAFLNPDGSRVAILYRRSGEDPLSLAIDGKRYVVALPKGSVATLRWGPRSAGK